MLSYRHIMDSNWTCMVTFVFKTETTNTINNFIRVIADCIYISCDLNTCWYLYLSQYYSILVKFNIINTIFNMVFFPKNTPFYMVHNTQVVYEFQTFVLIVCYDNRTRNKLP